MDLPELAIRRPYAVAVAFLIVVLLGAVSLLRLPVDLMPDISYPTLTVSTEYPGVGPEEIETLLTRPIEEAVAAVQSLEQNTSTSLQGRRLVRLSFAWGHDLSEAADDVRARVERIRNRLPTDVTPPAVLKFDLAAFPVMFLAVSGDLGPLALRYLAENQVKPRIERLPGVAAAEVRGGLLREIRVEVDRQRLWGLGLGLDQVIAGVARENLEVPAGDFRQGDREMGLRVKAAFTGPAQIAHLPIIWRNQEPVRVSQFATVVDTHQDVQQAVRVNGVPGLQVVVRKQSGTNTVAVASAIASALAPLNAELRDARVDLILDTSTQIRQAIRHLGRDLLVGATLAVGILLVFLRSWRSTLVVATAIPISVMATFALLYTQGLSLNTMTLGGLALGLGRLLDDAIVVIENIYRRRAMGDAPLDAALLGTRQVSLAIIASTVTTLVVFLPLVFQAGYAGVLFQQLALVVSFSLASSTVVAQGLIPLMAARFLPVVDRPPVRFTRLYAQVGTALERLQHAYARALRNALRHGRAVVLMAVLITGGALAAVPLIGTDFMPVSDQGEVRLSVEAAPGTALDVLESRLAALENLVRREVPEAVTLLTEAGGGGWRATGSNTGSVRIVLTERSQRRRDAESIAQALRRHVSNQPGLQVRVSASSGSRVLRLGQSEEGGRLTVEVRGYDRDVAKGLAARVAEAMGQTPGIADVQVAREVGRPEAVVRVDRARAAALGVSASAAARALEAAVLGTRATLFREAGEEYPVTVRLAPQDRRNLDAALDLPVSSQLGPPVLLRQLVYVEQGEGPARIDREGQERVVEVSAEVEGRDLGAVVAQLREGLRDIPTPGNFALVVRGDFEAQQEAFEELAWASVFALLLVYLVLVAQFESLRHPFVILLCVPVSLSGVVAALLLTGTTFNVQSFIGVIVLIGVVVSNGIIMVDFINQLRQEDRPLEEAIVQGAELRLRPVLMTTATTVLAMLPMALGLGEGGELQAPMARVVIGGLLASTVLTLFLVPVVYRWLNRERGICVELKSH